MGDIGDMGGHMSDTGHVDVCVLAVLIGQLVEDSCWSQAGGSCPSSHPLCRTAGTPFLGHLGQSQPLAEVR